MPIALAIHGGAGAIPRTTRPSEVTPTLDAALDGGMAVLTAGAPRPWEARHGLTTALSAAMAAVEVFEACPRFNASVGSVLTTAGTVELEASVMEGRDGRSGAVTGVTAVTNPTRLAALVLATTPHTGTVGAVALDADGHLAVATSTGGLTAKWPGRIGDTPVVGAGFYAANGVAAISSTGRGEAILTSATSVSVVRMVEYAGVSVGTAADRVLGGMPAGTAGLVAVSPEGEVVLASNAAGMYCGGVDGGGWRRVRIWDEDL
ncbi:hypothetical protein I4F81_006269 [Pyropia yezoensis]|uniref:Uncharacterized protein n=1 Tax=Pyropia yezoensis TaxID=2788 RepID=A0ACC3C0I3_PYRYE|nr:hypothetical protein I4F81_006269 [Neopyropia yezoensis]